MNKIERAGTGIIHMRDLMSSAGLKKPEFDVGSFFTITLYRSKEYSLKNKEVNGGLILDYIAKNLGKRVSHMVFVLKLPKRTIENNIKKLKSENKILFKGASKTGG